ncbi:hypothetical protein AGR4B_Lc60734 [Agrobacterium tumefaciens str. CFBP 5621]|nr:hypothetical protein AGR4B_Lc60734 [Agrobacterium tumefaciens str. CFBP 5621]
MRAGRAFPLGPRPADLKAATSAVSTLIRGLYSNDFTLRGPLRKQYAFRRYCAFLTLPSCPR